MTPKYINKDKPEEELDEPPYTPEDAYDMGEGANDSWGEELSDFGKDE